MTRRTHAVRVVIAAVLTWVPVLSVVLSGGRMAPRSSTVERGTLPVRWTPERPDCGHAPQFMAHEYNPTFIILRQSGCTNFEKPFLYLLLGSRQALLVDTGASPGCPLTWPWRPHRR